MWALWLCYFHVPMGLHPSNTPEISPKSLLQNRYVFTYAIQIYIQHCHKLNVANPMLNHLQFYYYTLIGCKTIPTWRLFIGFSCVDNPPDWCTSSLIHFIMFSGLGWRMEITILSKHIQTFSGKPIYKQLNPKCWSYKPSKPSLYLIAIFLEVSLYHPHLKPHFIDKINR